ncbi:MAG: TA system antitoxin ParD family protein [Yoonia sp.]|uniref:TA system antitoxin ParD family protein n=1 Tax=Yoonia sp. TaxID=2212373 RepID=UPI003EF57C42
MAQSIKLSDDVMSVVRRSADLQSRSVAGQITHWINIGRAIEQSGAFDYQHINAALAGTLSPDELSAEEHEVWFAQFGEDTTAPSDQEEAFFAQRRQLGRGVGLNDKGELVYPEAAA